MEPEQKVLLSQKQHFNDLGEPHFGPSNTDKGIDKNFSAWGEKDEHKSTHFPSMKDDKALDENPLFTQEDNERLPTDTMNERETMGRFYDEAFEESKLKTQNRDKRLQSLTRSSLSSDKPEDRKSRSLERPEKSSSINQFSSQYQFNRETDPNAFKRYENEESMSALPLSLNLEDLVNEEEKLTEIFDYLKREWEITSLCDDWWELSEESCLMSVSKYFKEEKLVACINSALKLQTIVVGYTNHMSTIFPQDSLVRNLFKNLNSYIHQNYTLIIILFLQRLTESVRNTNRYALDLK